MFIIPLASYKHDFYNYTLDGLNCIFGFGGSHVCDATYWSVATCCKTLNDQGTCSTDKPTLGMFIITKTQFILCMLTARALEPRFSALQVQ